MTFEEYCIKHGYHATWYQNLAIKDTAEGYAAEVSGLLMLASADLVAAFAFFDKHHAWPADTSVRVSAVKSALAAMKEINDF